MHFVAPLCLRNSRRVVAPVRSARARCDKYVGSLEMHLQKCILMVKNISKFQIKVMSLGI